MCDLRALVFKRALFCLAVGLPLLLNSHVLFPAAASPAKVQTGAVGSATSTPEVSTELTEAQSLLAKGLFRDAENISRSYVSKHPDAANGHYLLGQILFTEQRPKESLAEYTEGAKYHEPNAFDLKVVALDYVLLFDYLDADKWLTKSLQWNPNDSEAWYYLGRTKYNENRFEEAVKSFERCLKLDSSNVKAEDNLGLSYQGLGRVDDAITAYRTAIAWQSQSANQNPQPYIDLGSLLLEQGKIEDAIAYLRQAIAVSPQAAKAHEQLGKAYMNKNQFVQAQEELEKAVALNPKDAPLHYVLGQVYRKRGLMDKAKAEFDRFSSLQEHQAAPEVHGPPE